MAKFYKVGLSAMMMFTVGASMAQQKISITGRITDSQGAPLSGVTIREKGGKTATSTNEAGQYAISVLENATLLISYIGYQDQEINPKGRSIINISLEKNTSALDEVVVVGYGTQKKVNLTGSVATVGADKLTNRPIMNLAAALGGTAPGIRVTQGNGNPGSEDVSIRVRGTGSFNNNNPLILVDGAVADMVPLNTDDIENISILKDAAS
ncbi:MAG: carboxypeptidase-like regulatory domain-containing protein, partial [Sphingobacterium paramultivorum]